MAFFATRDGRMHLDKSLRRVDSCIWVWVVLANALMIPGCGGDGKIAREPVHGSVNIDGKPAQGAMVIFCPIGGSPELQKMRPSGFTDASGKFELISVNPKDGAPVGQYKVLVQWPAGSGAAGSGSTMGTGEDRLHGRYMNLEKSPFTVEIKAGTNDLPPFDVKSK